MRNEKLFERARNLKLVTKQSVDGLFSGNYRSIFKGLGIEFDEVREYTQDDDARFIDWNVSSRIGSPYLKTFKEERELVLFLIIDVSASLFSGTGTVNKKETAGIVAALLAFAAVYNNDRAGALFFSDRIEKFVPPMKGKTHVLRLVQDLTQIQPRGTGSDLGLALRTAFDSLKRRGICVIISDFRTGTGYPELSLLSRKHDLIAVNITDPLDTEYPRSGLFELRDPETGETILGAGMSKSFREDYRFFWELQRKTWMNECRKRGVSPLLIGTNEDPVRKLADFFIRRRERAR